MNSVVSVIENTISISLFNRGMAGKIFSDVRKNGAKVVIKNNVPECVLLSPDEYISLMETVCDAQMVSLAGMRLEHFDSAALLTMEEVNHKFGISENDLEDADEVELE